MERPSEGFAAPGEATSQGTPEGASAPRAWQPIGPIERRILGVLVEKAKTTPEVYPLSLNAITTGANQKSNRHPVMQLEPADVEAALERLRAVGAVALVEGYGRVPKYRHYIYEWLGVDKVEAAVMAELLLRGPQTEGELRARASRMEPMPDLGALRQVLASLQNKGLIVSLRPEGRGHVVAHALYPPREMERLQAEYRQSAQPLRAGGFEPLPSEPTSGIPAGATSSDRSAESASAGLLVSLQAQLEELRQEIAALRQQVHALTETSQRNEENLSRLQKELGV